MEDKKIYKWWWDHLLKSEKYRTFCEFQRKIEKNPELPWPEGEPRSMGLGLVFENFGDVFQKSFKDWWKTSKDRDPGIGVVEYDRLQAEHEFNRTIKDFLKAKSFEKPDDRKIASEALDEFKEFFVERLLDQLPASFLCRVCFHPKKSPDEIVAQFRKLAGKKRKEPEVRDWEKEMKKGWLPVGRKHPKKLEMYFKAKRLQEKNMKIGDIITEFDTEDEPCDLSEKTMYQYIQRAKNITENVDDGFFPESSKGKKLDNN